MCDQLSAAGEDEVWDNESRVDAIVAEAITAYEVGGWVDVYEFLQRQDAAVVRVVTARLRHLERVKLLPEVAGAASASMPLQRVGAYRLIRPIGRGAMGTVFLAHQEPLDRPAAVKVLHPWALASEATRERFQREGRALAALDHPNIVRVIEMGEEQGLAWFAMELIEGEGFHELLRRTEMDAIDRSVPRMVAVVRDLALALECAHEHHILHRDVKPSNIIVTEGGRPVLLDFGLAKLTGLPTLSTSGSFQGSLAYAAPEALSGGASEIGTASDVYSLGVVLYEALSGTRPFDADSADTLIQQILNTEPKTLDEVRRDLPRDLVTVVAKATAKRQADRYATARAFADDLTAVLELRPVAARRLSSFGHFVRWCRRRPALAGLAALVILLMTALPATVLWQQHRRFVTARDDLATATRELSELEVEAKALAGKKLRRIELRTGRSALPTIWQELEDLDRTLSKDESRLRLAWDRVRDACSHAMAHRSLRVAARRLLAALHRQTANHLVLSVSTNQWFLDGKSIVADYANVERELAARYAPPRDEIPATARVGFSGHTGASVHVFRLVEITSFDPDGEPRTVPVPLRADPNQMPVRPGTWTLRVLEGPEPLAPQDQIVRFAGHQIEGTVFVTRSAHAKIKPLDRLVSVNGVEVFDLERARRGEVGWGGHASRSEGPRVFRFARGEQSFEVRAANIKELVVELGDASDAVRLGGPATWHRDGRLHEGQLPPGTWARMTAAPILGGPDSFVGTVPFQMDLPTGSSYLAVGRKNGYCEHRRPVALLQDGRLGGASLALFPRGIVPEDFVFYEVQQTPPVHAFMQDREVICSEYEEFLNSDTVRVRLAVEGSAGERLLIPDPLSAGVPERDWHRSREGAWCRPTSWDPDLPVLGVTWFGAKAYADWRTDRAAKAGSRIVFSLPGELEGSARRRKGVLTYGSNFRSHWQSICGSRPGPRVDPVLSSPRDESLLGVFDLCGSAAEWMDAEGPDLPFLPRQKLAIRSSWAQGAFYALIENNHRGLKPTDRDCEVGFRLKATHP